MSFGMSLLTYVTRLLALTRIRTAKAGTRIPAAAIIIVTMSVFLMNRALHHMVMLILNLSLSITALFSNNPWRVCDTARTVILAVGIHRSTLCVAVNLARL
jgi:hypothetical protein